MYGNDNLERSPPHLYSYLVLNSKQQDGNKIMALLVLRTRSNVYGNDYLERSPPYLYLYLVLNSKQKDGNKIMALLVLRTREP